MQNPIFELRSFYDSAAEIQITAFCSTFQIMLSKVRLFSCHFSLLAYSYNIHYVKNYNRDPRMHINDLAQTTGLVHFLFHFNSPTSYRTSNSGDGIKIVAFIQCWHFSRPVCYFLIRVSLENEMKEGSSARNTLAIAVVSKSITPRLWILKLILKILIDWMYKFIFRKFACLALTS